MRPYALAIFTAALLALPTSAAFSQVDVEFGPGGVRVGPGYHRHYYNRYEGGRCAELRQACLHKEELGEQGMGNCQRYRAVCR
jgi:predicted ribosomally synthesized peptide with SipW-like signal peptide